MNKKHYIVFHVDFAGGRGDAVRMKTAVLESYSGRGFPVKSSYDPNRTPRWERGRPIDASGVRRRSRGGERETGAVNGMLATELS